MASKAHLSSVPPGARAKVAPKNITESLEGDGRTVLVAMRRALAKKLDADEIAGNSIASAYRELRELDRLIRIADAELAAEAKKSDDDGDSRSFDASAI